MYLITNIINRCVNSWCTKNHGACKARFTLGFTEEINQLIVKHQPRSEKNGKPVFKLEKLDHEALFKNHNYNKILNLEYFCIELGCYTSELDAADFGKVLNPDLEEIQEIESASFLSFREVLCYE